MVRGRGREGSRGQGPASFASRHSSSAASGGCTGTLLFWLPVFSLQDPPCPSLTTLLAKGQMYWGAESLPRVQKGRIPAWKLCALSPPFIVPTAKSPLLWTEMEEKRDASGWILVHQCKLSTG